MSDSNTEETKSTPPEPEYWEALTLRNRGLISAPDQRRLAEATILIAGCGSTGGAAVEPLVRAGARSLLLAEPGEYELTNLNRQRGSLSALGTNKAEWLARSARAINPYGQIDVYRAGITEQNVRLLCDRADLIIDAVDVTSHAGLAAKLALHEAAAAMRRPTVCAYDLAYRQYVRVYDYRKEHAIPFDGKASAIQRAAEVNPMKALSLLVPFTAIPFDLVDEIARLLNEPGASISQLGCTADLFGALIVPLTLELLAGRPVRSRFHLDIKEVALPLGRRLRRRVATLIGLAHLLPMLINSGRNRT